MSNGRFVRWQGLAITQLTVAVALLYGLSIGGLGAGLALLSDDKFVLSGVWKKLFGFSLLLFVIASLLSCAVVITRLLDFRLTARKVRQKNDNSLEGKPLSLFWCDCDGYGRATWRLFWLSCIVAILASSLFVVCVATAYADKLY